MSPNMKTRSRWTITVLACIAVFLALAAFKIYQIRAAIAFEQSFPEPSETVEAETVSSQSYVSSVVTIGEVVAPQALELRNELEGRIALINVTPGEKITKGSVVLQLDISEETARLKAAEANVKLAGLELARIERLIKQKTVSKESLDQAEANFAVTQANVLALKSSIGKKTLRAPFDAIAGLHTLEVGEFLQANTPVMTLVGTNNYSWVDFRMPQEGSDVAVGTPVSIVYGASNEAANAIIIAKDTIASADSRNVRVRAQTDRALGSLPNTVVKVTVPIRQEEDVVVPASAVLKDGLGDYVYVLNKDDASKAYRAERRQVTLGHRDDKQAAVLDGLKTGELIATNGSFKLRGNLLTHVREKAATGAGDGAAES